MPITDLTLEMGNFDTQVLKAVEEGKRSIRNKHYPIQSHDILLYQKKKYETAGCHNNGVRAILLPEKKSVALKQLTMYQYAGGYYRVPYESNKKEERTGS